MAQPADFEDAHLRHWEDAGFLRSTSRLANADHLYGFSAECGLKAIMQGLGMTVDQHGSPTKRTHRVHINRLWDVFHAFATGRPGARYSRQLPSGRPFKDWAASDRYANRGYAVKTNVDQHRDAARKIRGVVDGARQDGIL